MTPPSTDAVVTGALVLLLVYEGWSLGNRREGDTISETVWRVVYRRPYVALWVGILLGHWFWLPDRCWELVAPAAQVAPAPGSLVPADIVAPEVR